MYRELHCHSAFSFLDGASLPDELVPAALELGYEAVALTDHNSVSGSMEFAVSARALGLRPIHGAEIDLDDGRHLTLLVQDARGWSNLCPILTRAQAHTRAGRDGAPPTHPRNRAPLQDAFVAIRLHTTLDASEPQRRGNFSHVLTSPEEMAARFAEYPDAVAETARLTDRLQFDLGSDLGYRYPGAEDEE